jgi:hypothetical protein
MVPPLPVFWQRSQDRTQLRGSLGIVCEREGFAPREFE